MDSTNLLNAEEEKREKRKEKKERKKRKKSGNYIQPCLSHHGWIDPEDACSNVNKMFKCLNAKMLKCSIKCLNAQMLTKCSNAKMLKC